MIATRMRFDSNLKSMMIAIKMISDSKRLATFRVAHSHATPTEPEEAGALRGCVMPAW